MNDLFASLVYFLCFLASVTCAWLLGRSYRVAGARLLLWSCLCFSILAVNNLILVVDLLVMPTFDLRFLRVLLALAGVGTLLFGFIWDVEEDA